MDACRCSGGEFYRPHLIRCEFIHRTDQFIVAYGAGGGWEEAEYQLFNLWPSLFSHQPAPVEWEVLAPLDFVCACLISSFLAVFPPFLPESECLRTESLDHVLGSEILETISPAWWELMSHPTASHRGRAWNTEGNSTHICRMNEAVHWPRSGVNIWYSNKHRPCLPFGGYCARYWGADPFPAFERF